LEEGPIAKVAALQKRRVHEPDLLIRKGAGGHFFQQDGGLPQKTTVPKARRPPN
jgi:hypothetical protein